MDEIDFGNEFIWGVSSAAFQVEGAPAADGKGPSIWDTFTHRKNKTFQGQNADRACEFYHRFPQDLELMASMGIRNFRYSFSWSRLLPKGKGTVNPEGINYYHRLLDACHEYGITPWMTLYHWDLPQALQDQGGWTNRDILGWFEEYVDLCVREFGDKVNHWMVLNEPMVFTGAGYFLGVHAPGIRGIKPFLLAALHATLAMGVGGRTIRSLQPDATIGTTFSCSHIEPVSTAARHQKAARRADALINRLFIEPILGHGFPEHDLPVLSRISRYMQPGDMGKLAFDFDFIGIQNYTREIVKHSLFMPFIHANLVKAEKRQVPCTLMGWEVYPEGIYHMLKKFAAYPNAPRLIVTENGAAFSDLPDHGEIEDTERRDFLKSYIRQVGKAKEEGVQVDGYFVWTFTDNFEWAEGFAPRFGLVYVNFETQERIIKRSGMWYGHWVRKQNQVISEKL